LTIEKTVSAVLAWIVAGYRRRDQMEIVIPSQPTNAQESASVVDFVLDVATKG